jgi:hypothetical protein
MSMPAGRFITFWALAAVAVVALLIAYVLADGPTRLCRIS